MLFCDSSPQRTKKDRTVLGQNQTKSGRRPFIWLNRVPRHGAWRNCLGNMEDDVLLPFPGNCDAVVWCCSCKGLGVLLRFLYGYETYLLFLDPNCLSSAYQQSSFESRLHLETDMSETLKCWLLHWLPTAINWVMGREYTPGKSTLYDTNFRSW